MAAPSTTNEVTVRRLSSVITGLWNKITALLGNYALKNGSYSDITVGNCGRINFGYLEYCHVWHDIYYLFYINYWNSRSDL